MIRVISVSLVLCLVPLFFLDLVPRLLWKYLPLFLWDTETTILSHVGLFTVYILYVLRDKKHRFVPLLTIIGVIAIVLSVGTVMKGIENTNFYAFVHVLTIILLIFGATLFAKKSIPVKAGVSVLIVAFIVGYNVIIPPFTNNHLFFGSLTGKSDVQLAEEQVYAKELSHKVDANKIPLIQSKKVVVLDFWNNGCGMCFKKFPKFGELTEKYIGQHNVKFFAVNILHKEEDLNTGIKLFNRINRGFPSLYMFEDEAKVFDIKGYPTTIVIEGGKITYRGNIEVLTLLRNSYLPESDS